MGLQELWFFLIAALFLGFLILEGFKTHISSSAQDVRHVLGQ